jgi:hypothetical protein
MEREDGPPFFLRRYTRYTSSMDLMGTQFLPAILSLKNIKILTFSKIFSIMWVDSLFVAKAGKEAFV